MQLQLFQDNILAIILVGLLFVAFGLGFEYRPAHDKKMAIKKEKEKQRKLPRATINNNKK